MNRLWVQLSLAFGSFILIGVIVLFGISFSLSRLNTPDAPLLNAVQTSLLNRLETYYRAHQDWAGIDTYLAGVKDGLDLTTHPYLELSLVDSDGKVLSSIYSGVSLSDDQSVPIPLIVDGTAHGSLVVKTGLRGPQLALERFGHLLQLGSLIGGGLALLFGIWMSRRLSIPLSSLERAAQAIGTHQLTYRVPLSGSREIMTVARTFNQMATSLEQAEQARRHLMADIAHELRTPLTVLQGNLRALLDNIYPLDKAEILRLYNQTSLLSRLVNDVRDLSLAETQQLRLDFQLTDMATLIAQTVDLFSPLAQAQGVSLLQDCPENTASIQADSARIAQVLHNLVSNALRHTPSGGVISLIMRDRCSTQNQIEILVQDSGEGIAPEHLPHIFERFYRVDRTRSPEHGGTGLGLAIVQALVEAHQGKIVASSPGVGKGTTFSIQLTCQAHP